MLKNKQLIMDSVMDASLAAQENFVLQLYRLEQSGVSNWVERAFSNALGFGVSSRYSLRKEDDAHEVELLLSRCRAIFFRGVELAVTDGIDECRKVFKAKVEEVTQDVIRVIFEHK